MTLHYSLAELDACRSRRSLFLKRGLCRFHLLFCRKCRASLKDLKDSDEFLAAVRKVCHEKGGRIDV